MIAKLINQSGVLGYQVSIHTKDGYVAVHLNALVPGIKDPVCIDAVTGIAIRTNGILEAMLRAEQKWGIDLIKYEPETLKQA